MNTGEKKAREALGSTITTIGSGIFINQGWINPNIWDIESVKQGCDIRFSSCVIVMKLECHG
jgi:hypothetical protein